MHRLKSLFLLCKTYIKEYFTLGTDCGVEMGEKVQHIAVNNTTKFYHITMS